MKFIASIFLFMVIASFGIATAQVEDMNDMDTQYEIQEEIYFFNELDYSFYQAYNAYMAGMDEYAGEKIIAASRLVRAEANSAKVTAQKPITKQADKLYKMGMSIKNGKNQHIRELRKAFYETHHILAKEYKGRAVNLWATKQTKATGHALKATAGYLGHAAKWSGKKVEQGVVTTAKGAKTAGVESFRGIRWLSGKLIQGVAFIPENVGKAINWLGNGIEKVGEEIEPEKRK